MNKNYKKIAMILLVMTMVSVFFLTGCSDEEIKTQSVVAEIPFETVEEVDDSLPPGEKSVKVMGENGFKRVTYEVKVVDGKESSRKIANEKVIKKPIDEVIAIGPAE